MMHLSYPLLPLSRVRSRLQVSTDEFLRKIGRGGGGNKESAQYGKKK
jgi:hypothetical protein